MNRLFAKDPALAIWAVVLVLIVPVFVFPADMIVSWIHIEGVTTLMVRVLTIAYALVVFMLGYSWYSRIAARTANEAANYDSVKEATDDVDGDVATQNILLSITVSSVTAPIIAALCFLYTGNLGAVWRSIPLDWVIGYTVFVVFNIAMTNVRKYELHLTVENAMNRMREQNPGIFRKE